MELLFNDLSLHGQFHSARDFEESIGRVMEMRALTGRFGRKLHCHRNLVNAQVTPELRMPQVVGALGADTRRALMGWLTKYGPFIEDIREHDGDDYLLAYGDEDVTDTAVGEAAYRRFSSVDRRLVSVSPSTWNFSLVPVAWHNGGSKSIAVENYWERDALQRGLESAPAPMQTWRDLEGIVRTRYTALTFSDDAFEPILHNPFVPGAAKKINQILGVLHELKHSFDAQGRLTNEGQELRDKHFTGEALISDSSDTDKERYRKELTFPNPSNPNEYLFCPMRGKVNTNVPIRVHYHWPIRADAPVYVVYVGRKIATK